MNIREAVAEDKAAWDRFVDSQGGGFGHYFDWKYVYEAGGKTFIPLMLEAGTHELTGIFPIVKVKRFLYATLDAGAGGATQGILLSQALAGEQRKEAISALLEYVDRHLSGGCSTFRIVEIDNNRRKEDAAGALASRGFRFRHDVENGLPCTFVLELKKPFEENVWKRWPRQLRKTMLKTQASDLTVIDDTDLKHTEDFIQMSLENYRRHGTPPPSRDEIRAQFRVFKDRLKLFVALRAGTPVVALQCYYTPSTCYLARVGSHRKDTDYANRLCFKMAIEDACNSGRGFADFGYTDTPSLAFFKERFRGTRFPVRIYEKTYSAPRTFLEKAPVLIRNAWHDKGYIWSQRQRIWDRVVHI